MTTPYPEKPGPGLPTSKTGMSGVAKVLLGCAAVAFLFVLLCAGVGAWGYRWVMNQIDEFAQEFESQGYERQTGQVVEVNQSPTKETLYVCQILKIDKDVDVDIAIACQVAEINANIHGDFDFLGQVLKVGSGVVIDGDLRVKRAQVVEVNGEVKGKISGGYGVLTYKGQQYQSGKSPSSPEAETKDEAPPSVNSAPTSTPPEASDQVPPPKSHEKDK